MNTLITLVKMQLKEKLNTNKSPFGVKKAFSTLFAVLTTVLKFAVSTILCSAAFIAAGVFPIFEGFGRIPEEFISFIFAIMLFFSICSCTARLTKAMYFSKDNASLLTLPAKPLQVYLSKLIIFFVFELKKNFSFIVPMFVAYFITQDYPAFFYLWILICFLLISALTVSISSLLSIPSMWVATIFKQNKPLQTGSILLIIAGLFFALNFAISIIPEDLNLLTNWDIVFLRIQEFLSAYSEKCAWIHEISLMIVGTFVPDIGTVILPFAATGIRFSAVLLSAASIFVLGLLIVRPFFYSMASKPFEYLKKQVKPKKNRAINSAVSPIFNEFLKMFKDSARLFTNIAIMIATPVLILLLNSLFIAMNTDTFGDQMIVSFNLMIILLVALNTSSYAASVYSRDGRSAYLIKVQPKNPTPLLIAKLIPTTVFNIISFIITFVILLSTTHIAFIDCIYIILGVTFIYLAHLMYSAGLDIITPHTEIYAAMGEYENDPNELKSTAYAFAVSFIATGAVLLLLITNDKALYLKLFLVGLAIFIIGARRFLSNIKLYYKDN